MLACSQINCLRLYFKVLDIHLLYDAETGSASRGQSLAAFAGASGSQTCRLIPSWLLQ